MYARAFLYLVIGLTACSSHPNPKPDPVGGPAIALPRELSAIAPHVGAGVGGRRTLPPRGALAMPPADSDYAMAPTITFVYDPALGQFEGIEHIVRGLMQSGYASDSVINTGPYRAIVSFSDGATKQIEQWTVNSVTATHDGVPYTRVDVWTADAAFEFMITEAPQLASDGTYLSYGAWRADAFYSADGAYNLVATAARADDGTPVLELDQHLGDNIVLALWRRGSDSGIGNVQYADYEACQNANCAPVTRTAKFVYDATTLGLQRDSDPVVYRDRTAAVEIVRRYGMYAADTGRDVNATHQFGFPVHETHVDGSYQFDYYGTWQGRHQIYAPSGPPPAGTTLVRDDVMSEPYTASDVLQGTLARRTLSPAQLSDVRDIPLETYLDDSSHLRWTGTVWLECHGSFDFSTMPPGCVGATWTPFTRWSDLVLTPTDTRRNVYINRWDAQANKKVNYVYDPAGSAGAGLYVANIIQNRPVSTGVLYTPATDDLLNFGIVGSVFFQYDGTGWVRRTVLAYNDRTGIPTFDPTGDTATQLVAGQEYYFMTPNASFVITLSSTGVYQVGIELQRAATPVNAATFVAPGMLFQRSNAISGDSTYRFDATPGDASFMKLVYDTVGANDSGRNLAPGDVVTDSQWSLVGLVGGTPTVERYNWDYAASPGAFGSQQYLKDASGNYVTLDDAIRTTSVTLHNHAGQERSLLLQYDGWFHGMDDAFSDLERNGFRLTTSFAADVIDIPAGTQLQDADQPALQYLVKPLEITEVLPLLQTASIDLSAADTLMLDSLPTFVMPNMPYQPPDAPLKFSEGQPVQ